MLSRAALQRRTAKGSREQRAGQQGGACHLAVWADACSATGWQRLSALRGGAQGSECFAFFLQSGLGKGVLKDVWAAVAGNEGRLSAPQFLACLYLMDLARRGLPVPAHAPPAGPDFPPIAGGARPGSGQLSLQGMQQARRPEYPMGAHISGAKR